VPTTENSDFHQSLTGRDTIFRAAWSQFSCHVGKTCGGDH